MNTLRKAPLPVPAVIALAGALAAMLAFCSLTARAASTKDLGHYDASLPPERQCTLLINGALSIKKFGGQKVKWYSGLPFPTKTYQIVIPDGHHVFSGNWAEGANTGDFSAEGDFKAQGTYKLNFSVWQGLTLAELQGTDSKGAPIWGPVQNLTQKQGAPEAKKEQNAPNARQSTNRNNPPQSGDQARFGLDYPEEKWGPMTCSVAVQGSRTSEQVKQAVTEAMTAYRWSLEAGREGLIIGSLTRGNVKYPMYIKYDSNRVDIYVDAGRNSKGWAENIRKTLARRLGAGAK